MQQLLTGKSRIAKFKGSWKLHKIGDLASVVFSNVDKKTLPDETPVRLCNYTDVYYNNRITRNMTLMNASATDAEIKKYKLRKNDVVITKDSETALEIAISSYVAEEVDDVICGYHLAIIRPKASIIHGPFLSQLLMTDYVHCQFVRNSNGVTRFGLTNGSVKRVSINIPSVEEQRFITKILQTADNEITQLEQKLTALEKQKLGLM